MSKYQINVKDIDLGSDDTEIFEGSTPEEAAFRAGFSMGAYFAFQIPPTMQPFVGDAMIDAQGLLKNVIVTEA